MGDETQKTILLVDDEPNVRKGMQMTLRSLGYTVIEAEDYETAKEILERDHASISAIVTDYNYPGIDFDNDKGGADLVALATAKYGTTPLIVMTGQLEVFKAEMLDRNLQPAHVFPKPLTKEIVAPLLGRLLANEAPLLGTTAIRKHKDNYTPKAG